MRRLYDRRQHTVHPAATTAAPAAASAILPLDILTTDPLQVTLYARQRLFSRDAERRTKQQQQQQQQQYPGER